MGYGLLRKRCQWLQRGRLDINSVDQSTVRLLCPDVVEPRLAVVAMERVGYAPFGGAEEGIQKNKCIVGARVGLYQEA